MHVTLPLSLILIGIVINLEEFFVFSRIIRLNTMETEHIIANCCHVDSIKKRGSNNCLVVIYVSKTF